MSVIILLAPTAESTIEIGYVPTITVEAEYGGMVLPGEAYTAAHHQPRGTEFGPLYGGDDEDVAVGQRAPCKNDKIPVIATGSIVVSHMDLDTLGGILRALGSHLAWSDDHASFWDLAEYVDLHGPHNLAKYMPSWFDTESLYAWWAWSKANRKDWPKDKLTNITDDVDECIEALRQILQRENPEMILLGHRFKDAQDELSKETLVAKMTPRVLFRKTDLPNVFLNAMYLPGYDVIVGYNNYHGNVTLSVANPIDGFSCRDWVKAWAWRDERGLLHDGTVEAPGRSYQDLAGGHDGIAGTARGVRFSVHQAESFAEFIAQQLVREAVLT